jgi:hypothetical protein
MATTAAPGEELACFAERPDADEGVVVHKLLAKWTLWFDAPSGSRQTAQDWTSNMSEVFSFESVEDFWRYNVPV